MRAPKVGEVWITNSGAIVYFSSKVFPLLTGVVTQNGLPQDKKYIIHGDYMIDWFWYNKNGTFDGINGEHEMDCAKFLCKL